MPLTIPSILSTTLENDDWGSGWDDEVLAIELQYLTALDLDFDISIAGFEMAEIDLSIQSLGDDLDDGESEEALLPLEGDAVTKLGDIWQLGKHLLICGDSLNASTYQSLMDELRAHVVFTDPPYNVPINGHVCGNGAVKHDEFAMASGEMSEKQFHEFLLNVCKHMKQYSHDGSLHYICMDWRHVDVLLRAGKSVYDDLKNICIWNKDNGGMGSLYRSKHEMVTVFKHGAKPHTNNIELGKHGRYRTNVWDYKGINSFGKNQSDLHMHPTVKPVSMIADAMMDCTHRNHIVLDPFAGSGSTLIAAEKAGRIARCIEIDPHYCDAIIKRWQSLTGEDAIHPLGNKSFNDMEKEMNDD